MLTGLLELIAAGAVPRETNAHWLWGTAGVFSLFLAILLQLVPNADVTRGASVIAVYAVLFGVVVITAAYRFRREHRRVVVTPGGGAPATINTTLRP